MLQYLAERASSRKLRLFGSACCRQIWHLVPRGEERAAREGTGRYADRLATLAELESAGRLAGPATWASRDDPTSNAAHAAWQVAQRIHVVHAMRHVWYYTLRAARRGALPDVLGGPAAQAL